MTAYDVVYSDVLAHCRQAHPSIVYVGIGCAANALQQNPPFLDKQWPDENKVLVLIDPALDDVYVAETTNRRVFDMRAMFYWPSVWNRDVAVPHMAFLADLFAFASASPRSQVIVQDFTGEDIRQYFMRPTPDFAHGRILFDATYAAGGCQPDLDAVRILRMPNGDFVQPRWLPMRATVGQLPLRVVIEEMRDRAEVLADYVHRYYHMCMGTKPVRDWCSATAVGMRATRLFHAYNIDMKTEKPIQVADLHALLVAGAIDFCVIAKKSIAQHIIDAAIENPEYAYRTLLRTCIDNVAAADKTGGPQ